MAGLGACHEGRDHSFVRGYCWRCGNRRKPLVPVVVSPPGPARSARWCRRVALLMARDGFDCWICEQPFTDASPPTIDHIIPLSKGGTRCFDNEKLAHGPCNNKRGNDEGAAWRAAHGQRPIGLH